MISLSLSLSKLGVSVSVASISRPSCSYDRYRNELKGDWKEAHLPAAGIVYNLGSHIIDQVVSLLGRPEKVTGFVENIRELGHPDVDDSVSIPFVSIRIYGNIYPGSIFTNSL